MSVEGPAQERSMGWALWIGAEKSCSQHCCEGLQAVCFFWEIEKTYYFHFISTISFFICFHQLFCRKILELKGPRTANFEITEHVVYVLKSTHPIVLKSTDIIMSIVSDVYLEHQNFFKSTREIFENPILRTSNCSKYYRPCSKCSVVLSYPLEEANLEHMPNFRELPKYVVSNMSLVHLKLLARILEIPKPHMMTQSR